MVRLFRHRQTKEAETDKPSLRLQWPASYSTFSIVGPLLAQPPERGELTQEIERLSQQSYPHPTRHGEMISFAVSTVERWYYAALGTSDPIAALSRKVRTDAGIRKAIGEKQQEILKTQYGNYPNWSVKLHSDNLAAFLKDHTE